MKEEVESCAKARADLLHMDIMDGHFVPNISFGPRFVKETGRVSKLPMEVHLMVERPLDFVEAFADAGAAWFTVHAESQNPQAALDRARQLGMRTGLAIKPGTPVSQVEAQLEELDLILVMSVEPGFSGQEFMPSALGKIEQLARIKRDRGLDYIIAVDGGVNAETGPQCIRAGAEMLAVGSAFFRAEDRPSLVKALKDAPAL